MMEYYPERTERLNYIWNCSGLTRKKFAEKIGYNVGGFSTLLRGERNVTPKVAQKINAAYPEYAVDWILCMEETAGPKNKVAKIIADINPAEIGAQLAYGTLVDWCDTIKNAIMEVL